jgi:hypothetical protein
LRRRSGLRRRATALYETKESLPIGQYRSQATELGGVADILCYTQIIEVQQGEDPTVRIGLIELRDSRQRLGGQTVGVS